MKKTIASVVSTSLLLSGVAVTFASALDAGVESDLHVGTQAKTGEVMQSDGHDNGNNDGEGMKGSSEVKASSTVKIKGEDSHSDEYKNATSGEMRDGQRDDNEHATSTHGDLTSEEHRSTVASLVKSLLSVADHEQGGIGDEVRMVARDQDESASTTADAMDEVDGRSPITTFFIGSDFKHLGVIRSEISTTQNNIDHLKTLSDKAGSASDKAELSAQISVLQDSQAQMDAYVQAHEQVFSLFGWLVKLFGSN